MRHARPLFAGSYPGVFMEGASRGEELLPGELCTRGGIYQVIHQAHRMPHNVLVRKGDRLPRCTGCGQAVRFRLIKQVEEPPPVRAKRARKKSAGR
jgi:hypothetical protein